MSSIYITVLLFLGCFTYSLAIYKTCLESAHITKVLVNNKLVNDDPEPVQLKKGENATLEIDFIPGKPSKKSTTICHGIIAGIPVPFPVEKDGCKGDHPHCPLKKGANVVFNVNIGVKKVYPSIKLIIKWEEVGDDGKDILCLLIPAVIV